jgi:hypothetical protein
MDEAAFFNRRTNEKESKLMRENLKQYKDHDLKGIILEAQKLLDERDRQRKEDAMKRIRAMAAEVGLAVEVKGPKKKRGRPSQAGTAGSKE